MQTISIGYGQFRSPEWLDELNLSPGERKTYEYLAMASKGQDHAWPSQDWLAKKVCVTTRSIRNYIRKLEEESLLMTVMERINGRLRLVYYFLAHPVAVAARNRKNFPVTPERISGHLNKRKKNIQSPPTPPQGEAAGAAKEREHEQSNQTDSSTPGQGQNLLSHSIQRIGENPDSSVVKSERESRERNLSGRTDGRSGRSPKKEKEKKPSLNTAPWQAALALLLQKIPEQEVNLWLAPIQAMESEAGLRLDCPDRYIMAWVKEHFGDNIRDALQHAGITEFYFTFGAKEQELRKEKDQEQRAEEARLVMKQSQALERMTPAEQFAVLLDTYPPHRRSGEWSAFRVFQRVLKRGETSIFDLLTALKRQKTSEHWQTDQGRWIPGIGKWLGERRWADTL